MGTKMDVADISLALGYADPSGFTHAFQRWFGTAPIEWRKHHLKATESFTLHLLRQAARKIDFHTVHTWKHSCHCIGVNFLQAELHALRHNVTGA